MFAMHKYLYIYIHYWQLLALHYCYVFECPYIYTIYTYLLDLDISSGNPGGATTRQQGWCLEVIDPNDVSDVDRYARWIRF